MVKVIGPTNSSWYLHISGIISFCLCFVKNGRVFRLKKLLPWAWVTERSSDRRLREKEGQKERQLLSCIYVVEVPIINPTTPPKPLPTPPASLSSTIYTKNNVPFVRSNRCNRFLSSNAHNEGLIRSTQDSNLKFQVLMYFPWYTTLIIFFDIYTWHSQIVAIINMHISSLCFSVWTMILYCRV